MERVLPSRLLLATASGPAGRTTAEASAWAISSWWRLVDRCAHDLCAVWWAQDVVVDDLSAGAGDRVGQATLVELDVAGDGAQTRRGLTPPRSTQSRLQSVPGVRRRRSRPGICAGRLR